MSHSHWFAQDIEDAPHSCGALADAVLWIIAEKRFKAVVDKVVDEWRDAANDSKNTENGQTQIPNSQ